MTPETMTQIITDIGNKNSKIVCLNDWATTPEQVASIQRQVDILAAEIAALENKLADYIAQRNTAQRQAAQQEWAVDTIRRLDDPKATRPLRGQ